jgi:hypothetical protein
MARLVAAFGTSHSTMLLSPLENWLKLFDHVDVKAPIYDFAGQPRSFEELLEQVPASASQQLTHAAISGRFEETARAMVRLETDIVNANLDALIIVGDDQREIFKDACRPAIAVSSRLVLRRPMQTPGRFRGRSLSMQRSAWHPPDRGTHAAGHRRHRRAVTYGRTVRGPRLLIRSPQIPGRQVIAHSADLPEHLLPAQRANAATLPGPWPGDRRVGGKFPAGHSHRHHGLGRIESFPGQ